MAELRHRGTIANVAEAFNSSAASVSVQLTRLEREAGVPILHVHVEGPTRRHEGAGRPP